MKYIKYILLIILTFTVIVYQYYENKTLTSRVNELKKENISLVSELVPLSTTEYFLSHNLGIVNNKELLFSYGDLLGEEYVIFFYREDCDVSKSIEKEIHKMLLKHGELPIKMYYVDIDLNPNFKPIETDSPITVDINSNNFALFGTPIFLHYDHGMYSLKPGANGFEELFDRKES